MIREFINDEKRKIPPHLKRREVKYGELEFFVEESLAKIYKGQKS